MFASVKVSLTTWDNWFYMTFHERGIGTEYNNHELEESAQATAMTNDNRK